MTESECQWLWKQQLQKYNATTSMYQKIVNGLVLKQQFPGLHDDSKLFSHSDPFILWWQELVYIIYSTWSIQPGFLTIHTLPYSVYVQCMSISYTRILTELCVFSIWQNTVLSDHEAPWLCCQNNKSWSQLTISNYNVFIIIFMLWRDSLRS